MGFPHSTTVQNIDVSVEACIAIDSDIFRQALKVAYGSTAIKATRRIFFNHLEQSIEERGSFFVDQMYGAGSGVLIKYDFNFYLLTADHVIGNATSFAFGNESPFWIPSQADRFPEELRSFLMPAQIIHIGEGIPEQGQQYNSTDLLLVELFFPDWQYLPDKFIDLDINPEILATEPSFNSGLYLLAAGYPFETNDFKFLDVPVDGITHSTRLTRQIISGVCSFDGEDPFMMTSSEPDAIQDLSGASGGVVTNIPRPGEEAKMLGMLVSAGGNIVRFVPSYVIAKALANKSNCRITPVDPAFKGTPSLETRKMLLSLAELHSNDVPSVPNSE